MRWNILYILSQTNSVSRNDYVVSELFISPEKARDNLFFFAAENIPDHMGNYSPKFKFLQSDIHWLTRTTLPEQLDNTPLSWQAKSHLSKSKIFHAEYPMSKSHLLLSDPIPPYPAQQRFSCSSTPDNENTPWSAATQWEFVMRIWRRGGDIYTFGPRIEWISFSSSR